MDEGNRVRGTDRDEGNRVRGTDRNEGNRVRGTHRDEGNTIWLYNSRALFCISNLISSFHFPVSVSPGLSRAVELVLSSFPKVLTMKF